MMHRLATIILLSAGLLVVTLAAVWAQDVDGLRIDVRGSTFAEDGTTELVVNVTGPQAPETLGTDAFTIVENGEQVVLESVSPIAGEAEAADVVTLLAIDISGSMRGASMQATRPAAIQFARNLADQDLPVALMTFGSNTTWLLDPTTDADQLSQTIEDIVVGGSTALYDAIIDGSERLADLGDVQRNIVVFTDRGGDTSSDAELDDAVSAANEIDAQVLFAALEVVPEDLAVINAIAEGTDGRVLVAATVDEVAGVFETLATDLASQYLVTYTSPLADTAELDVEIAVSANGGDAATSFVTSNPRQQALPTVREPSEASPLASSVALYAGVAAAFLAMAVVFGLMLAGGRSRGDRVLAGQLERYLKHGDQRAGRSDLVATHFRERAMELLEATPRPKGFDENLRVRLEQAAWPLRNSEFLLLSFGAALLTGVVVGVIFNALGGVLVAIIAGAVPWALLESRRARRQRDFLRMLPDTLQLMAGSLRAGYGVVQALDSVAKESSGPAAEEFQRVITEARLGMAVEDALEAMAERIGSEDFRWVVLAINIQRETGGNLAELLDTVAATLREREMLRRQISVLSAEGRLSATILIALPFVLSLYLILARPEYISALVTSGLFGWMLVIGAVFLMGVGVIWIRKMIQIEV